MWQRLAFVLFLLVPFCGAADKYQETKLASWDFISGGQVELALRFGQVEVIPSEEPRLTLIYVMRSRHKDFSRKVETQFEVGPAQAKLSLRGPSQGTIDVQLKVPLLTDLYLRVFAGDISVGRIEGSKDVETRAGDIRIFLPQTSDLGSVDASTHAGDVKAPFGKAHGWIGNKLEYQGGGKYRLHAHTFAGDIDIDILAAEATTARPEIL